MAVSDSKHAVCDRIFDECGYGGALESVCTGACRSSTSRPGVHRKRCAAKKIGILILGDQIIANSLRAEIYYVTGKCSCVGLPFGAQAESLGAGDRILKNEERVRRKQSIDPEITVVIGDPLYRQLLDEPEKKRFLPGVALCSFQ